MMPPITAYQIQVFLTVAEKCSFTKAGEDLFLTHSSVSKIVQRLEEVLGFRLIDRTTKSFSLTPNGEKLYQLWSSQMKEFSTVFYEITDKIQKTEKTITIGVVNTVSLDSFFWDIVERFKIKCPNVILNIESESVSLLIPKLIASEFDFIFGPDFLRYSLETEPFMWKYAVRDRARLIVPYGHRLSDRTEVTLQDISDETIVGIDNPIAPDYYRFLQEEFQRIGKEPKIGKTYKSSSTIRDIHDVKDALIITDAYFDYRLTSDTLQIPIRDLKAGIICGWKKTNNRQIMQAFIGTL